MAEESAHDSTEVSLEEIVKDPPAGLSSTGRADSGPDSASETAAAASMIDPNAPPVGDADNPQINIDSPTVSGHDHHESHGDSGVDALFAIEDPGFAASMGELHAQVEADNKGSHADIEVLDLTEKAPTRWGRIKASIRLRLERWKLRIGSLKKLIHAFKVWAIHAFHVTKKFLIEKSKLGANVSAAGLKAAIHWFKTLPLKSKLLVFAVIIVGTVSVMTLKLVLKGNVLPTLEMNYLKSFADIADAAFKFDSKEEMEDFADPFFHPEHVMLIDKIVVNLRTEPGQPNPMGLFEFYIESSSDEGAIEIKDREGEVRDVISRTLEQMDYDELVTVGGKNHVKIVLRRALNQFLTKGRVLRVYFRNVILKG